MKKIAYVGIDYHQNTLTIAVRLEDKKKIHDTIRIKNEDKIIRKYLKKLSKEFDMRACPSINAILGTRGFLFSPAMAGFARSRKIPPGRDTRNPAV